MDIISLRGLYHMLDNIILATDSYKITHWRMYPPDTSLVYSYLGPRAQGEFSHVVFFGLQYFLKRYFEGTRVTREHIEQAESFFQDHFGQDLFYKEGWIRIVEKYQGRLPVKICAVEEGQVIPENNVMLTIENTDPQCFWLTNHLETLLVQLWYPCSVATVSREQKKIILSALERSGTPALVDYKLHDFGYRGSTSPESAGLGGAAHLVNFKGTDTLAACELATEYYNASMPGVSIPASEHSTITSWGQENELLSFRHIIKQYPTGLLSVVSDSWDIRKACEQLWGTELKNEVSRRNGVLVIRPDSGDPEVIVPEALDILSAKFGHRVNSKGYKVLPEYLRLIQGDGISRYSLKKIIHAILKRGYSLDNVTFGSGGGLLQDVNRDTQRFAMKCSYVTVNGKGRDVYKFPSSDPTKKSKSGRLKLVKKGKSYETVSVNVPGKDELNAVFENGNILKTLAFDQIRENASLNLI